MSLEFQTQLENVSQKTFGRGADTCSAVVSDWELIGREEELEVLEVCPSESLRNS